MVNFILQEAHEKGNEIRVKTEHDFNLEKQTLVHEAKLAVQDEFTRKQKDRQIQERIAQSAEIGSCKVKKMEIRDNLLQSLVADAGTKASLAAKGSNYPELLQQLILQGLIKIEENDVEIYCRAADKATVEKVLPKAVAEYVKSIKEATGGIVLKPNVTVNSNASADLSDDTYGGVILTALRGKIVCDNTLKSRLTLVYSELLPAIRAVLFPEDE